ncbi:MAG: phospho-sugar mutase [Woeseiaceae bacterium]
MSRGQSLDEAIDHWLARDPDPAMRAEIQAIRAAENTSELEARFTARLAFGTAGLRGVVGAGPGRMNRLVIRETSAGLAQYLLKAVDGAANRGIVVGYDARPDSRQFAEDAVCVFAAFGFRVFLTATEQPTPVGAFAVTELNAAAGIVVTASHNPPEYNGYKVYWENGAQIIPPHDRAIADHIDAAAMADLPWKDFDAVANSEQLALLDDQFVAKYSARVVEAIAQWHTAPQNGISVAYTALHGVGAKLATALSAQCGIQDFWSVPSQHEPDGQFPTVDFPNPEEDGAMDAVIALAAEHQATLACANDPDADRLAVAARDTDGNYVMLSGDQIGILLGDYCLRQQDGETQILAASLVSSRMLGRIAESANATYLETLTGFKWLSNMALAEQTPRKRFVFAYEEALGYAMGQIVRDKDGLSALMLFCQLTATLADQGKTVFDRLEELYVTHGLFLTHQQSIRTTPGQASITDQIRRNSPDTIGGIAVTSTKDLQTLTHRFADGREVALDNHPNDVVIFYLEDDSRIIVRPSGTEPKTKCYYEVKGDIQNPADYVDARRRTRQRLDQLIDRHQSAVQQLMAG